MTVSLVDLDSMIHIVSYVQWKAGNRSRPEVVTDHVNRFTATIEKNAGCESTLRFYQDAGHHNYRKELLPEYKEHRKTLEHVKHWKPTIIKAFSELGAIPLHYIESDDAMSIVGREIGLENITLITSDKDMKQMACKQYNPFNAHYGKIHDPRRWNDITETYASNFLWEQVLSGDSTDMPGRLCGIEGVGSKTAKKALKGKRTPEEVIEDMYTTKYGEAGTARADLTMQMVRLLTGDVLDYYISDEAKEEVENLKLTYEPLIKEVTSDISNLFSKSKFDAKTLFNH